MPFNQSQIAELLNIFLLDLDAQAEGLLDALLKLERHEDTDEEGYAACMRSAHNLKGGARGLGLVEMVDIFHALESRYQQLRDQGLRPDMRFIELNQALFNAVREAVNQKLSGVDESIDLNAFLAAIESHQPTPDGAAANAPAAVSTPASPAPAQAHSDNSGSAATDATDHSKTSQPGRSNSTPSADSSSSSVVRLQQAQLEKITAMNDELLVTHSAFGSHHKRAARLHVEAGQAVRQLKNLYAHWNDSDASNTAGIERLFVQSLDRLGEFEQAMHALQTSLRFNANSFGRLATSLGNELQKVRLVAAKSLLQPLLISAHSIAAELGKPIQIQTSGEQVKLDRLLIERLLAPLGHILRNAIDHGLESPEQRLQQGKPEQGHLDISITQSVDSVRISVRDDGRGMDLDTIERVAIEQGIVDDAEWQAMSEQQRLNLVFLSGFSTRRQANQISGRGVGMDQVNSAVAALRGHVSIETHAHAGTHIHLDLPFMLARERGLTVNIHQHRFVLSSQSIERIISFRSADIEQVEGGQAIKIDGRAVALRCLALTLGLEPLKSDHDQWMAIVASHGQIRLAFLVSDVEAEQDIIIKPLADPLHQIANLRGATYDSNGNVIIVLDAVTLLKQVIAQSSRIDFLAQQPERAPRKPRVLVVDDSLTTRALEKNILEASGYNVSVCVNGREALTLLESGKPFDIVVTDIEMPAMNGFELTEAIKADPKLSALPVIIVTSLEREDHRQRGLQAGADAYIIKSSFESQILLETIARLI